jgi:hypothetical protein
MKHGNRNFSKKKMFPDAVRKANKDGKMMWFWNDKEYVSLRSIVYDVMEENAKKKEEIKKTKPLTK